MNKTPPDFTRIFFESLGGAPAAIMYPLRHAGNTVHDVVFLSSLLHDARVLNPKAQPSNGRLDVRFNRDCWELGMRQTLASAVLHVVDSVLSFAGVIAVDWKGRRSRGWIIAGSTVSIEITMRYNSLFR